MNGVACWFQLFEDIHRTRLCSREDTCTCCFLHDLFVDLRDRAIFIEFFYLHYHLATYRNST